VEVMWVKGSGGDLGTLKKSGLAALYVDRLNALKNIYRGIEHEDEMVELFNHCIYDLASKAPSIDTPLHGFLPFKHIDHLHPDAAIAIAAAKDPVLGSWVLNLEKSKFEGTDPPGKRTMTFQAVSGMPVRTSLWDAAAEAAMGHIEVARWAEQVVIAPATANTIAKLVHGFADDLVSTLCLATTAPIAIAPAMNHRMWLHPATQANIATLHSRGVQVIGPADGPLAEGESGPGRLSEPDAIVAALARFAQDAR